MGPETKYAKTDGGHIAYQVFGQGPVDLIFITNWSTNLEVLWDEPLVVRFFTRLAAFSRVLLFDKRGTGVSDPVPLASLPTLEEWMEDARVVMDTVRSERAAVLGDTEGGPMAMMFAATYPQRTAAMILLNTFARMLRADAYPIGLPARAVPALMIAYQNGWGTPGFLRVTAPSVADDARFARWFARLQRLSMPPTASSVMYRWVLQLDVRRILPAIRVPTLILHRQENTHYRLAYGRYLAEHIPDAKFIELPDADCYPFYAGNSDPILDEIQEFLTGRRERPEHDRTLATVLFTDIAGSTEQAARVGDAKWLNLRESHNVIIRQLLRQWRGQEVQTTGDGFLATFDGPARAIRCAADIVQSVRSLGLEVRAGLHTGEVELHDGHVAGIAVHIAARVMAATAAGHVLVSGTVKDLVVGSGIEFTDAGAHTLKGVPGEWRLFEVARLP